MPFAINKKLVCLTDTDPTKKTKPPTGEDATEHRKTVNWTSCAPFELNQDNEEFEYKPLSDHVKKLKDMVASCSNISVYTSPEGKGKTLEYDLIFNNPDCLSLITDSFPSKGPNRKNVMVNLVNAYKADESFDEMKILTTNSKIVEMVDSCDWTETEKKKALIAAIYAQALKKRKGEHALYLEQQLRNNFEKGDERELFVVPEYISDAITFILS